MIFNVHLSVVFSRAIYSVCILYYKEIYRVISICNSERKMRPDDRKKKKRINFSFFNRSLRVNKFQTLSPFLSVVYFVNIYYLTRTSDVCISTFFISLASRSLKNFAYVPCIQCVQVIPDPSSFEMSNISYYVYLEEWRRRLIFMPAYTFVSSLYSYIFFCIYIYTLRSFFLQFRYLTQRNWNHIIKIVSTFLIVI